MSHATLMSDVIISMYIRLVTVLELVIFIEILLFSLQGHHSGSRIILGNKFCVPCKRLYF